jgi:hypothetical protein
MQTLERKIGSFLDYPTLKGVCASVEFEENAEQERIEQFVFLNSPTSST